MASIEIKSYNQILGNMVRQILAETPLSDVNAGSILLSLLEACASNDFENNVAILNVLQLLNVDAIRNNDLDNKAADFGLTRKAAVSASGTVTIQNGNITKQSTNLYSIKPAPISGQTVLFVNNTAGWAPSGSLYIGRGTNSFEGPISYTSITTFGTYSQINLGSALQKDHLGSDTVINSQGQPDRLISAGTIVKIPSNNQSPEILYATIRDAVLPSGEDKVEGVLVSALVPGSQGNAFINTINKFDSAPFSGAVVTNTSSFSTGRDVESDVDLRNRIKSYAASLARGTRPAIVSAVLEVADQDENKRVISAVVTKPTTVGEPALLYVDDGSGFQPSYAGQSVDNLLTKANGTEEFLQLANFPLPRPQVVTISAGPFSLVENMFLRVAVDGVEETIVFTSSDFLNITVATASEVVIAINNQSTLFKARLTNQSSGILLYPVDADAEFIQVIPLRSTDDENLYANALLSFPTDPASYIALFQNNERLVQRAKTATVETVPFASWNLLSAGSLILSVDNTPAQTGSFSISDFPLATSFGLLTLADWVDAFNAKFAGITATATPASTMQISSNKVGSKASIKVLGGTYSAQMFATLSTSAVGQTSDFEINRQTGAIKLLTEVVPGDVITAGTSDAKGFVVSTTTSSGTFNLDVDTVGRASELVLVTDATKCNRISVSLLPGQPLVISDSGSSRMRIMASTADVFKAVQPGHFVYIAGRSSAWVNSSNTGLFKVVKRGAHTAAGTDTYVEVLNNSITPQTVTVADVADMVAFETDVYPQIWRAATLPTPVAATLTDIVNSINKTVLGVKASIFRSNSVKLTSTTETAGSIAVPVAVGNVAAVFATTTSLKVNNQALIANKASEKDMFGPPRTQRIHSKNAWLNRAKYPLVSGAIDTNATENLPPYSAEYAETIHAPVLTSSNVDNNDTVFFIRGNNKNLIRPVGSVVTPSGTVNTRAGLPRTLFNHVVNDEVLVTQSLKFAADDSILFVMDEDPSIKTIEVKAARTGQVNSGSASASFIPTTTEFSANDVDNEPGIDFSNPSVWSTSLNNTNFADYTLLMRARNWYASGGTAAAKGKMIVRSVEYGINGNNMCFTIKYPSNPNSVATTQLVDTPSFNILSYLFGSGADRAIALSVGGTFSVKGPYANTTVNFPGGTIGGSGNYYDITFNSGSLASVQVNDVLSFGAGSGVEAALIGQFGVKNKSGNTVRVFAPNASEASTTQTINNTALVHIFPILGTSVSDIATVVNASNIIAIAPIGDASLTIVSSTEEDFYTLVSAGTALALGHDPASAADRAFISLFDGINSVRTFSNSNPNFVTKSTFELQSSGVSSSVYSMNTSLNEDGTTGEYFKLVPTTVENIHHHLTQKALSQLPIVANITTTDDGKNIQIVSRELGSSGAIQVVGGEANKAQASLIGESELASDAGNSYLLANIPAFPNTFMAGDVVKLQNQVGVKRLSRLNTSDTISVATVTGNSAEYYYNPKVTNFVSGTAFTITDVSTSYTDYDGNPMAAGMVWRWTHTVTGGETLANIAVGDVVAASGSLVSAWKQGVKAKLAGDDTVAGLPIIAVDDATHHFDVVCPFGKTLASTTIGTGSVKIWPTPRIKWNLAHAARIPTNAISRVSNVVTVDCLRPHNLSTGDSVAIKDSSVVADGTYASITTTSATSFTFADVNADATEAALGATIINSALTQTQYRLQKLGMNGFTKIARTTGASPRFADAGVAVDDYLVVKGTTFSSLNNGTFRVVAVDNDSVVFVNPNAVDNTNKVIPFNGRSLSATWTANSTVVTGVAGTFKNLSVGVWVKKVEDDDSSYVQVVASNTGNFTTATQITLGSPYAGISAISFGVSYDQVNSYDVGVLLADNDDITAYEGDSALVGDSLFVQTASDSTWFAAGNSGSFAITTVGCNPSDLRPFVRVKNSSAVTETNRAMSANISGYYIVESNANKFSSYRTVVNSVQNDGDNLRRSLYMVPDARQYKFSQANTSFVTHTGKLGYDLGASVGTDGYLFYTGLLRRVQRTVDGFDPDPEVFPERRGVGSWIETLPPLVKNIVIQLTVSTQNGFVLQDITNNIKSAIIDYVMSLGTNEDVILAKIIGKVIQVRGVAAATFNVPAPTEERIKVASNERAIITADNIGIT
jgi:hypothetical protein